MFRWRIGPVKPASVRHQTLPGVPRPSGVRFAGHTVLVCPVTAAIDEELRVVNRRGVAGQFAVGVAKSELPGRRPRR